MARQSYIAAKSSPESLAVSGENSNRTGHLIQITDQCHTTLFVLHFIVVYVPQLAVLHFFPVDTWPTSNELIHAVAGPEPMQCGGGFRRDSTRESP